MKSRRLSDAILSGCCPWQVSRLKRLLEESDKKGGTAGGAGGARGGSGSSKGGLRSSLAAALESGDVDGESPAVPLSGAPTDLMSSAGGGTLGEPAACSGWGSFARVVRRSSCDDVLRRAWRAPERGDSVEGVGSPLLWVPLWYSQC